MKFNKFAKSIMMILVVILMCQPLFVSAAEVLKPQQPEGTTVEKLEYSEAYNTLAALGMISSQYAILPANGNISRAQYAYVIAKLMGYNDSMAIDNKFVDMKNDNFYTGAVNYLRERKVVNGINQYQYAPNEPIQVLDAAVISTRALGYEDMAKNTIGGPDALKLKATQLGLLNSIENIQGLLNVEDAYELLLTTAKTPVMDPFSFSDEYIGYSIQEGDDMLSIFCGIKHPHAVITDNGVTALDGPTKLTAGKMIIGGKIFTVGDNYHQLKELIGRYVEYYYNYKTDTLLYAVADEMRNNVVEVDARDLVKNSPSLSTTNVPYYEKNGDVRDLKVSIHADLIYNGASHDFDKDDLKISSGSIFFISNDTDEVYDVIVVKEYNDYVVETVTDKIILTNSGSIDVSGYDTINVYDETGEVIDLSLITGENVITVYQSHDKRNIDIYRSKKTVSGSVDLKKKTENEKMGYTISDTVYVLSPALEASVADGTTVDMNAGDTYKCYINIFDEIIFFEDYFGTGWKLAYCVGVTEDTEAKFEKEAIAVLVLDDGTPFNAYFNKRFILNDAAGLKADDILPGGSYNSVFADETGAPLRQPVQLKFNSNGDIIEVVTALDVTAQDYPYNLEKFSKDAVITGEQFKGNGQNSVGTYVLKKTGRIIIDPNFVGDKPYSTEDIEIKSVTQMAEGECGTAVMYDLDETLSADLMVCSGSTSELSEELLVVNEIYSVWDADERVSRKVLTGYIEDKAVTYVEYEENVIPENISKGDICKYRANKDMELMEISRQASFNSDMLPFVGEDLTNSEFGEVFGYLYAASSSSVAVLAPEGHSTKVIGNAYKDKVIIIYDKTKEEVYPGTIADVISAARPNAGGGITITEKSPMIYIARKWDYINYIVMLKY